jgi:hypothetical protein
MRRLDQVLTWLILLVGLRLGLSAVRAFGSDAPPWSTAFYLAASAMLYGLCGSLNLLRLRYDAVAPGIRVVAAAANLALAALTLVANTIGGELPPALVISAILLGSAALGAWRRPVGLS